MSLCLQAYEYVPFPFTRFQALLRQQFFCNSWVNMCIPCLWLLSLQILSLFYPILLQVQSSDASMIVLREPFTTGILQVSEKFTCCFGGLNVSGHSAENTYAPHLLLCLAGLYSVPTRVTIQSSRFFFLWYFESFPLSLDVCRGSWSPTNNLSKKIFSNFSLLWFSQSNKWRCCMCMQ